MMIEDWEAGELYRKAVIRLGDREQAARSVRDKFLNRLCGPGIDTHFFVGTVLQYGSWIINGVFWPPVLPDGPEQLQLGF